MRRWIRIIIVVVVLVGGFIGYQVFRQSRAQSSILSELQTVAAEIGPLTATVGATGTVRANQSTILTFQTSGTVETVMAALGDHVQEAEILATLAQTSLPAQVVLAEADLVSAKRALEDLLNSDAERASAQKALADAQDALKDAEYIRTVRQEGNRASTETLDAARANLILAENEVDRAKAQYDSLSGLPENNSGRALALSKLADARKRRDAAQRNLNWYTGHPTAVEQAQLDADVAFAEARLADAEREWERVKDGPDSNDVAAAKARVAAVESTLAQSYIKAPFSGTITAVEVMPGDQVGPGTVGFRLEDLSRLLIDVDISEVDINRIVLDQPVTLNFDAVLDKTYQGQVVEIGLSGDVVQGVVNFNVVVEVVDADESIKPMMTTAANIVVNQIDNVLLVPNRAVRVREGERIVYVIRDNAYQSVPVKLGVSSDIYSQVLDGELNEGDLIVLNPPAFFETNGGPPPFVSQ
jgi:HlyD family secretion protein